MITRKPINLELGSHYIVFWDYNKKMTCRFIQTTPKGFNFLNLETSKCILPTHLYRSKIYKDFWVNKYLQIEKINN